MQKYFSLIWMDKIFFHSGALSQECNIKEGGSPQSDISWLQDGAKRMNCQDFSSAYASAKRAVKGPVACSHRRQSPDNGGPSPPRSCSDQQTGDVRGRLQTDGWQTTTVPRDKWESLNAGGSPAIPGAPVLIRRITGSSAK